MRHILTIDDLTHIARRRVPRMFFDYVDSGSWTEGTYHSNTDDFARIKLRQRIATDISDRRVAGEMLGERVTMPVALAPAGLAGMVHADGEILAAQAAEDFGVPFTLSTMSICSIEDVAAHTRKPFWFQLYVMRDRDYVTRLVTRAKDAGCSTLVVTLDMKVAGQRHKDIRNGLSAPPRLTAGSLLQMASKPGWCAQMLQTRRHNFGNVIGHAAGVTNMANMSAWVGQQLDPTLCWRDIDWLRDLWPGKLVLKGIMDAEDAVLAATHGADGIIVSNHGGRQLDGAPSTISALPAIAEAIGDKIEVYVDGGIRSGQDVLKALCLGAKGVFVGRPFLYGLGAMGKPGVTRALEILRRELDLTLALCGLKDVADLDANVLLKPGVNHETCPRSPFADQVRSEATR